MSRQFATIYDIFCPVPFFPSPFGFRRVMVPFTKNPLGRWDIVRGSVRPRLGAGLPLLMLQIGKLHNSGVAPANQTKERSVHELRRGIPEQKFEMWIVLVFLRKNTRKFSQKWAKFIWIFRFGPFFGLVCRGDSWKMASWPPKNPTKRQKTPQNGGKSPPKWAKSARIRSFLGVPLSSPEFPRNWGGEEAFTQFSTSNLWFKALRISGRIPEFLLRFFCPESPYRPNLGGEVSPPEFRVWGGPKTVAI